MSSTNRGYDRHKIMPYPHVVKKEFDPDVMDTLDIREDSGADEYGDYLELKKIGYDIVITNPPFHIAELIIEKAIQEVNEGGYVIMLLRLNFWGSNKRRDFLTENMPKYCYIHPRRMSFTDDGKTDSIEYAHFVWKKGEKNYFTNTKLL